MENKIKKHYNKITQLFKEHKSDTQEYKEELEKLLELTKDNTEFSKYYFESKFRLAEFYQRKHQYDLSRSLFLELINNPNAKDFKPEAIIELAYSSRISKRFEEAIFWYEKLLEISPSKYYENIALNGLAKCSEKENNFEKERKIYYVLLSDCLTKEDIKKLSEKIINLKTILLNKIDLKEEKRINDEITNLENLLNSSYEQLIDIRMKIAKSYFNEKNYEVCRNEIQTIFDLLKYRISDLQDYAITNANMLLGKTYFEENNLKKAREYFEPIANTSKNYKYYKYMISDIHAAKNFLAKMKENL